MNKEEVRRYWRRKERGTLLKVFCLSLIGAAILVVGCGESVEEINANTVYLFTSRMVIFASISPNLLSS